MKTAAVTLAGVLLNPGAVTAPVQHNISFRVVAATPAAVGKEKPNAAEAPNVNNGGSSSRGDAKPGFN